MWDTIRHFTPSEFDSPDVMAGGDKISLVFLKKIDDAREYAGIPFVITSGYRTIKHNRRVGGVPDSEHTEQPDECFYGVDVSAKTSSEKFLIIEAALICGITRIGVGSNFIHLGDSPYHTKKVIWTYTKKSRSERLLRSFSRPSGVSTSSTKGWYTRLLDRIFKTQAHDR